MDIKFSNIDLQSTHTPTHLLLQHDIPESLTTYSLLMKSFRYMKEIILETSITANIFLIRALSIKKTSRNNSACQFSQNSRRTSEAV